MLTSAYLAPVQYYTKIYRAPYIMEERGDHYVKQTYRTRTVIAGPDGPLPLTIPIEHGSMARPCTRDIRISNHGNWRRLHWAALVSAYENSPFFDYYAEDFRPFYEKECQYLVDFNEALREKVCELLDLQPDIRISESYTDVTTCAEPIDDLRETIRPKVPFALDCRFRPAEYYQVFSARNGFLPNLSMADLLFNMGPESRLVLRASIVEPAV